MSASGHALCEVSHALSRSLDQVTSRSQSSILCNSGQGSTGMSILAKAACQVACEMGPLQEQGSEMAPYLLLVRTLLVQLFPPF